MLSTEPFFRSLLEELSPEIPDLQYGSEWHSSIRLVLLTNAPSSRCWFLKGGHRAPALHVYRFIPHIFTARGITKYRLNGICPFVLRG
jgi:hypothetical protein